LGLAIAHRIVEEHNGEIFVESKVWRRNKIYCNSTQERRTMKIKRYKILVADDEANIREFMSYFLK